MRPSRSASYGRNKRYITNVFLSPHSTGAKKQAAEWLLEICNAQDKKEEGSEYALSMAPFANLNENRSHLKSQLTKLHQDYILDRLELRHRQQMRKFQKTSVATVAILAAIALVFIMFHFFNKKRHKHLRRQNEEKERQLESERHAHKVQQAALAGRLKRSNAALKTQAKTKPVVVPFSDVQDPNAAKKYADEPICQHILAVCSDESNPIKSTVPVSAYADIALTDAQKAQLKDAAMRHYGPLFGKLKHQYPELKEKDLLYCYLCLLGLDNSQIAVLTQLSYRTIWEREKRLQNFFHGSDRIAVILHEMIIH